MSQFEEIKSPPPPPPLLYSCSSWLSKSWRILFVTFARYCFPSLTYQMEKAYWDNLDLYENVLLRLKSNIIPIEYNLVFLFFFSILFIKNQQSAKIYLLQWYDLTNCFTTAKWDPWEGSKSRLLKLAWGRLGRFHFEFLTSIFKV